MKTELYAHGVPCAVNSSSDMDMLAEARKFFGVPCVVIKRTKAGLILVARQGDLKHAHPFPQRNVDVLEAHNAFAAETLRYQQRMADPLSPIELGIELGIEAANYLRDWQNGDVSQWT